MTKRNISGWDIGGAHLKVARCQPDGELITVIQVACPLWLGIEQLEQAIESVFKQLDNRDDLTAVTMTGELVDIFPDRQTGVSTILSCLSGAIASDKIHVYAAEAGWLTVAQAGEQWQQIASRNWQASASLVAEHFAAGLLVDIGSTTCDIIPFAHGQATPQGVDDFQRQTSGELLYTGAIRTPLIALGQQAPFKGKLMNIAAELFATTGDCWSLLGEINPDPIQDASADEQPWQAVYCCRRIARLLGTDAHQASSMQWQQLARWFAEQQLHQITQAILQVLSADTDCVTSRSLVGAGVGRFMVALCAQRLALPYHDFSEIIAGGEPRIADHAPAVAVALLAQKKFT